MFGNSCKFYFNAPLYDILLKKHNFFSTHKFVIEVKNYEKTKTNFSSTSSSLNVLRIFYNSVYSVLAESPAAEALNYFTPLANGGISLPKECKLRIITYYFEVWCS